MIRIVSPAALLLATTALVAAQTPDEDISAFINAPGFEAHDVQSLEDRLAQMWLDTDAMTPGGQVGPLEKAMMLADTAIASTRTRSLLSYGETIAEDGTPLSFIEVRHYNLGPAIHDQVAADYGAENTADPAEFGLGDHMAWRFVFQPVMNNAAVLVEASARIISDKEASKADCMGRTCLDLMSGFDEAVSWTEIEGELPTWPDLYPTQYDEIAVPAFAIAQLAVLGYWANAESGEYQWTGGEHPEAVSDTSFYRVIGVDRNLGQEAAIDVAWRESELNDDALAAIAFRRAEVAGQVYFMQASRPR